MSNSEFLEEILFEGHRLGIIDELIDESKKEITVGNHWHPCDAYFKVITKIVREREIQDSIFYLKAYA